MLEAGSLLHHVHYPFDIRGVFFVISDIGVGAPGHPFDHWFKWRKFVIIMDCCDPKSVADVESEHLFEIPEDLFLGPVR